MYTSYRPIDDSKDRRKRVGAKVKITARTLLAVSAALVLVLGILVSVPRSAYADDESSNNSNNNPEACNCVIFRLDDVQDYWLSDVQVAVMEKFISEHEKLTLGIITNYIGEDDNVVNAVKHGLDSGNFEVVNHSQNHESYADMSAEEQYNDLSNANGNITSLFGISPVGAFIPPFHEYNEDTLAALQDLDMKVISAQFNLELPEIYNPGNPDSPDNKIYRAFEGSDIKDDFGIYHLPQTIGYYDHGTFPHEKVEIENIMASIDEAISSYGYAVVTLHPQDFAVKDNDGNATEEVSTSELGDLDQLFSDITDRGYTTKTFSQAVTPGSDGWSGDNDSNSNGSNSSQNGIGRRPVYNDYLAYFITTYVAGNGTANLPAHDNEANYNNNFLMRAYPIDYLFTIEATYKTHDENILQWNNQYKVVKIDDGPIMHWHDLTDGQKVWLIQTFDHIYSTADVDKLIAGLMTKASEGE
ncbi:putative xylanase/chitin deacetylase [Candidatus Nitrososphaera evergladensis SR1]|uniref:Putative xylanase/chitin deacetylase n=1 Tax=Candidatus Nitrososphaera evergladensis SR1 TaxID=1459636 RepID=A0A075MU24_9ARCH|nr:polysaccharide deacetylase family protein [Candidatus Nitrososphaera evergladensis]AIF82784.1 putative xylanase/chitin deacetylase [Candidatus Nitrososphaera evergladensis SR1]